MMTHPARSDVAHPSTTVRRQIQVEGCVQGVGFRPFIYKTAHQLGLSGKISNTLQGAVIEVEGDENKIHTFLSKIQSGLPPIARIDTLHFSNLPLQHSNEFKIHDSVHQGNVSSIILPDLATCPQCLQEIFDPANRRFLYPFTNCTNCGPRFSIIHDLPYDRCNTSMSQFAMCPQCLSEYHDPANRRFHAQPNACPVCGPHIELWSAKGEVIDNHHSALLETVKLLRDGFIIAVKGLGGFQLLVDAKNNSAIETLRQRKKRSEKPMALMAPMQWIKLLCVLSEDERNVLQSYKAPIVLLQRKHQSQNFIADSIAGQNPYLGIMLPYTPLHHILLREFNFPIVATSGNLSDEPICTDEHEALIRLNGIADYFLVHNRPVLRFMDDSVVRIVRRHEHVIRRARGYAPLPIRWNTSLPSMTAVGGQMKNTVAVTSGNQIFISQHIGDLETSESFCAFEKAQQALQQTYQCKPEYIIHDMHPDYLSTKYAKATGIKTIQVQHHHAHILSCMAEHQLQGPVFGIAWDGTGYGPDQTVWGGEFLHVHNCLFNRIAALQPFPLIGGENAVKQIRLIGLGLLYELFGENCIQQWRQIPTLNAFNTKELSIYTTLLKKKINCPYTSSIGRLFDAVASLIGLRQCVSYEGQAACELEWEIEKGIDRIYPFTIDSHNGFSTPSEAAPQYRINMKPMITSIVEDIQANVLLKQIAAAFHNTLAECAVQCANRQNENRVVLSGGCFQNKYLLERTIQRLEQAGYSVFWNQSIPANDGGIALGQIAYASYLLAKKDTNHVLRSAGKNSEH